MSGTGGFQTQVYGLSAPGVAGDFCSLNPWFSYDAGPGGLVAGPSGLTIGRFAWTAPPVDPNGTNRIANNYGAGPVAGFVHRTLSASITAFLGYYGMTILYGQAVSLMSGGDFWVKNDGSTSAQVGQKAWASVADGTVAFAAAGGTPPGGASITGTIATQTTTFNGSIAGDLLTVSALVSGTIGIGSILTGGTGMISGTRIVSQVSGTTGGVGTYYVNFPNMTVASALLTGTYGLLTVSAIASGGLEAGDVLASGTAVTTGTFISALGTGLGGTGTYLVSPAQNSTAGLTITTTEYVETKWLAMSAGLAGELVKISDHATG